MRTIEQQYNDSLSDKSQSFSEKIIKIIKTVNLILLSKQTVSNMFKIAYNLLEKEQRYEEAGDIQKIEEKYQSKQNKQL